MARPLPCVNKITLASKRSRLFATASCGHAINRNLNFANAYPASKLGTCHTTLASFCAAVQRNGKQNIDRNTDVELSTLLILTNTHRRKILLGKKLRGFGTGKYNGFGGRLESTEIDPTPAHGAQRELSEEANISLPLDAFNSVGTLRFTFEDNDEKMKVHLFHANVRFQEDEVKGDSHKLSGANIDPSTIRGCDEMAPEWFQWTNIPLQQMFMDDSVWLTNFLSTLHKREESGSHYSTTIKLDGWFHFAPGGDNNNQIQDYFLDTKNKCV